MWIKLNNVVCYTPFFTSLIPYMGKMFFVRRNLTSCFIFAFLVPIYTIYLIYLKSLKLCFGLPKKRLKCGSWFVHKHFSLFFDRVSKDFFLTMVRNWNIFCFTFSFQEVEILFTRYNSNIFFLVILPIQFAE